MISTIQKPQTSNLQLQQHDVDVQNSSTKSDSRPSLRGLQPTSFGGVELAEAELCSCQSVWVQLQCRIFLLFRERGKDLADGSLSLISNVYSSPVEQYHVVFTLLCKT